MTLNNTAYIYGRYSSNKQKDGDSERRQTEDRANEIAKKHGLQIRKIFFDRDKSGYHGENLEPDSELNKLLSILRKGDTVLVEDTDRFTRQGNYILLPLLHTITHEKEAFVITTRNDFPIDKNNFQDLQPTVNGYLANDESKKKAGRCREAWLESLEKIKEGEHVVLGVLPFWLSNEKDEYKRDYYKKDDGHVATVKRIFDLYLAGKGLITISKILNREAVPLHRRTKQSNRWYANFVKSTLQSKAVLGLCDLVDPPKKIFPQIIDDDIWTDVQKLIEQKTPRSKSGKAAARKIGVLNGIIKCSVCGQNLITKICGNMPTQKGRLARRYYLRCCSSVSGNECNKVGIRKERFIKSLQDALMQVDAMTEIVNSNERPSCERLNTLTASLAEHKRKISNLVGIIENSDTDTQALVKRLHTLEVEAETLQTDIILEKAEIESHVPLSQTLADYKKRFIEKWDDPKSAAALRKCLHSMIEKIVVHREEQFYEIYFKETSNPVKVTLTATTFQIEKLPAVKYKAA